MGGGEPGLEKIILRRYAAAEARAAKNDARFEKRMKGFEKRAKIGMREMADLRRFTRQLAQKTDRKMKALIDSQRRTAASLRAYLDSRRGRNA